MPSPVHIVNQTGSAALLIEWDDGRRQVLSHFSLRQACRCADCKAHLQRTGQRPQPDTDIRLDKLAPVGQYGLQLIFSDRHERGIYPWQFLRELG